jgi:hypothetical protein
MSTKSPVDSLVAQRLGELELAHLRDVWALDALQKKVNELTVLLVAKDGEIQRLREASKAPQLQLENLPANPYENEAARH